MLIWIKFLDFLRQHHPQGAGSSTTSLNLLLLHVTFSPIHAEEGWRRRQHHPRGDSIEGRWDSSTNQSSTAHTEEEESSTTPQEEEADNTTQKNGREETTTQKRATSQMSKTMTTTRSKYPSNRTQKTNNGSNNNPRNNDRRDSRFGLPDALDFSKWLVPKTTQKPIDETAPPKGGRSKQHHRRGRGRNSAKHMGEGQSCTAREKTVFFDFVRFFYCENEVLARRKRKTFEFLNFSREIQMFWARPGLQYLNEGGSSFLSKGPRSSSSPSPFFLPSPTLSFAPLSCPPPSRDGDFRPNRQPWSGIVY